MEKKMSNLISDYFYEHTRLFKLIDNNQIVDLIKCLKNFLDTDKTVFICGNGGSAHNAEHYQTDWQKMIHSNTGRKLNVDVLTLNTGMVTAYSNDICFESIFTEQLKVKMKKDDLLICISGSGNSKNLVNATKYANEINANTYGILGFDGGMLKNLCKNYIHVPSFDMQLCEDVHLMICHIVMKSIGNFKLIKSGK
jgi:D-sedoheptulose 7-phosphate isomerase